MFTHDLCFGCVKKDIENDLEQKKPKHLYGNKAANRKDRFKWEVFNDSLIFDCPIKKRVVVLCVIDGKYEGDRVEIEVIVG